MSAFLEGADRRQDRHLIIMAETSEVCEHSR
jgi:hypothetical protein